MSKTASSAVDDLEGLNNNDLRAKCMEYGLPNVPITDTSRKLLIRRLRTAMEGGGGDSKATPAKAKSTRRETIHVVTKTVEAKREASPQKSRATRRTIATPSEPEEEPSVNVSIRQITTNRRRSRNTPVPEPAPTPVVAAKRKAAAIVEDDEDESDSDIQIVEDKRLSRSPSLSKSKTVTTSYKHVMAEEPIVEEPAYQPRETLIPVRREASYEPPRVVESYLSRPTTQQLSRPSLGTTNSNYTTQSSSNTTRRVTTSGGYRPQSDFTTSTISTHSYKPQSSAAYRHTVAENSEDNEEDGEDMDAPFLSDFARRLSRLKADPLTPGKLEKETVLREKQRYYTTSTSIAGRRGINNKDSLGESFRKLWFALDRQYGLRKYLAVIAVTLVVLFVIIVFVQN